MERPFAAYRGDEPYIFVSYAHEDADVVYPELTWLKDQGFNVWYDEGIDPGEVWREELAQRIEGCSLFLFFVSPRSAQSEHCLKEVNFGLESHRPLLVQLEPTELSAGLRMSLGDRQAIHRQEFTETLFHERLRTAVTNAIDAGEASAAAPATSASRPHRHSVLGYAVIALVVLVVAVLFLAWPRTPDRLPSEATATDPKTIAVLAFANMSNDPEMEYLGDGIAEELMNSLYRVPGLRVASRTDAFSFKGKDVRTDEIGRELGVATVLEGSVRKSGDRLRITAQLISVEDGFHLWSQTYDRRLDDIFDIQTDIALQVMEALKLVLGSVQEPAFAQFGTSNAMAYNEATMGTYYFGRPGPENGRRAIAHWERALELDPEFMPLYEKLSAAYLRSVVTLNVPIDEARAKARALIARALELDPTGSRSQIGNWAEHRAALLDGDLRRAEESLRQSIAEGRGVFEAPHPLGFAGTRQLYGWTLMNAGLYDAAAAYIEADIGTAPTFRIPGLKRAKAYALAAGGDIGAAMHELDDCLQIDDTSSACLRMRGLLHRRLGQEAEAARDLALAVEHQTVPARAEWDSALLLALNGDREAALNAMRASEQKYPHANAAGSFDTYLQLGEYDRAFDLLEAGLVSAWRLTITRPIVDCCAQGAGEHPRYQRILEKLGQTDAWRNELCLRARELTPVTGIEVSCPKS